MNKRLASAIFGVLGGTLACVAMAQSPSSANKEVATAHVHALMAQGATSVDMAHRHLHHVVNCLVGAAGRGFNAAAGDPCKGQGNGALPDSAAEPVLHGQLKKALADARAGLKATRLETVHKDAAKAAKALQGAPTGH
ncbi:MAG TPA: hypothetical protein VF271_10480 [Rhodanobacteraceae bacterium]